jgi:hypothetical protein
VVATEVGPSVCWTRWIGAPRFHRHPSRLVRGAVTSSLRLFLDRPQGILEGGVWPARDTAYDAGCSLGRLDDEPRAPRLSDAPHRAAQQVRQVPGLRVTSHPRDGDVHDRRPGRRSVETASITPCGGQLQECRLGTAFEQVGAAHTANGKTACPVSGCPLLPGHLGLAQDRIGPRRAVASSEVGARAGRLLTPC